MFGNGQNIYSDDKGMVGYSVDNIFGNGERIFIDEDAFDDQNDI